VHTDTPHVQALVTDSQRLTTNGIDLVTLNIGIGHFDDDPGRTAITPTSAWLEVRTTAQRP
jgi:hypothetical protein